MAPERILRIPRSDSPEDFVLVKVSRSGKNELDLSLVATEGEDPYAGSVKTSQISKLRAKNYRGSDEEWSGILSYVFNQDEGALKSDDWAAGLETIATVRSMGDEDEEDGNKEVVITLRKRIDAITQRLGSITLKQDDDQAIQLFDWSGIAVARANSLSQEIVSLNAKYRDAENTINQLNSQLEELIQAKKEHDDQLVAKFAQLLNEKKLKIRNQQRLLAAAKIDPTKAAELEAAEAEKKPRKADVSRKSKRKAQAPPSDSESEDAFDTMDVDTKDNDAANNQEEKAQEDETATESDRPSTPDPLEDEETASEDEQPEVPAPVPSKSKERTAPNDNKGGKSSAPWTQEPASSPPPRRELPFTRRGRNAKPAPVVAERKRDEVETESDDEL
ncbi:hypothetical protein D8B26_006418 [Coccidioides posadasii str. Silveira]|uniref:Uncharacterized protein n=1 Tax=Coccidioides posadasii (strain RMSCC 757 / Silveira) TaxID=443226 RepID=E9CT38_COCPS|nr:conserved hypothetical protein [Coccidioides posadasii str. Silveira]QVM11772.1 hypothetical protein D8B26_006418 [Coccidioides posadasii str. Silveira]